MCAPKNPPTNEPKTGTCRMKCRNLVTPRDLVRREGQVRLTDRDRPLLSRPPVNVVLTMERTDMRRNMLRRIIAWSDSSEAVIWAFPVVDGGGRSNGPLKFRMRRAESPASGSCALPDGELGGLRVGSGPVRLRRLALCCGPSGAHSPIPGSVVDRTRLK